MQLSPHGRLTPGVQYRQQTLMVAVGVGRVVAVAVDRGVEVLVGVFVAVGTAVEVVVAVLVRVGANVDVGVFEGEGVGAAVDVADGVGV